MNHDCELVSNDSKEIWDKCLSIIKDLVPEAAFSTWFSPIVPSKYEDRTLMLKVPTQFFYEYIEENYFSILKAVLTRVLGRGFKLKWLVVVENVANTTVSYEGGRTPQTSQTTQRFDPFSEKSHQKIDSQLNPAYTMDSFVEGKCNKLARSAGMAIAQNPGKTFNPMFVFGGPGMGKTHLVQAIGSLTEELHPEKNVLYVPASKFVLQWQEAGMSNRTTDFLNFYKMIDVLIVDDIQDLVGKTGTQNTFFQIFNYLHQSGKQLILTSDRTPKLLAGFEERMLSRFKWGLHAELEKPDEETRKAILRRKVAEDGLVIPEDVIDYITKSVTESVRAIEGVIISLLAQSTLTNAEINLELARRVVGSTVNVEEKNITVSSIQEAVCAHYHLNVNDIQTKSRKREVVQARQIAMYLARKYTKNSLSSIGEQIGNRDHATVLHACKTVTDLMGIDKDMRSSLDAIESSLR
ncbi:MAG: chromosomal replication initiator protein DnaA [Paludibacteraceae bacterium]|nr:chromosomal replication initiator protein DnaA [Paludibacteraceae bacterium]